MAAQPRVLVTGPTGTVGGPLLGLLLDAGMTVVAGARGGSSIAAPVELRRLDFQRPDTFPAALQDVDRVFLMRPPAISDTKRYLRPFLQTAQQRGVSHVVFLSVMGVNPVMPHWRVEQDLRASTMGWTLLRPSFFAQNLHTAYGSDIRDHNEIRLACGAGATSFIDTRDIAAVAALALSDPAAHQARAYTLTGPAALTYHEVASLLSAELARPILYRPLSLRAYRNQLRRAGLPRDYVTVQMVINLVARLGLAAKVTDTVERVLGRPATRLATYLHDQRGHWSIPD